MLFTSPRLRGEVPGEAQRCRAGERGYASRAVAPHPNPLPACGERGFSATAGAIEADFIALYRAAVTMIST
jgi:hypothetical protein